MSYQWPTDGYQPDNTPSFDTPNIAPPEDVLNSISYDQGNYGGLPSLTGSSFDAADLASSVNMSMTGNWDGVPALGGSAPSPYSGSPAGGNTKQSGSPGPVDKGDTPWYEKVFNKGMGFAQDKGNNKLLELGAGMILGVAKGSQAKEAAAAQAKAQADLLKQKDQLEQDANKRFSSSITGLRPVGLINQRALTRGNGSNVFNANGTMNTTGK